jgi:hypothetical protein
MISDTMNYSLGRLYRSWSIMQPSTIQYIFCTLIGLVLGLIIVMFVIPKHRVIRYPTMENYQKTIYVDDNNVKYKYRMEKVDCV